MFIAHVVGEGGEAAGCDYTIGCNQRVYMLPKKIESMKDAVSHVFNKYSDADSIMIYEVSNSHKVDVDALKSLMNEKAELEYQQATEAAELAELARLEKKYANQ